MASVNHFRLCRIKRVSGVKGDQKGLPGRNRIIACRQRAAAQKADDTVSFGLCIGNCFIQIRKHGVTSRKHCRGGRNEYRGNALVFVEIQGCGIVKRKV